MNTIYRHVLSKFGLVAAGWISPGDVIFEVKDHVIHYAIFDWTFYLRRCNIGNSDFTAKTVPDGRALKKRCSRMRHTAWPFSLVPSQRTSWARPSRSPKLRPRFVSSSHTSLRTSFPSSSPSPWRPRRRPLCFVERTETQRMSSTFSSYHPTWLMWPTLIFPSLE